MTIDLSDILTVDRTLIGVQEDSKKKVLELISKLITHGDSSINPKQVFEIFIDRERLGSTGIGHGVAIPHGRMAGLDSIRGALVHLRRGINYDTVDNEKVDLLFALLVPEDCDDAHLQVLATLAEKFSEAKFRDNLRAADANQDLYQMVVDFDSE